MARQHALPLEGGHHVGPLFVAAKRRAAKANIRSSARFRFLRRRTPAWADRDALNALRRLGQIYTKALGIQFSQDHIVPIRHELVCGLHCPANIELAPLEDNMRKGNRFWPEMPEVQLALF